MHHSASVLALFALGSAALLPAQSLRDAVVAKVDAEYRSLEAIYLDVHENPELSFRETRTAALLARELRALGIEVTENVGNTGIVGVLRNGPGPTVLVRADMDALPMEEKTGKPYASRGLVPDLAGKETPAMHACAHDAHVTGLIGTARVLAAFRDRWSGTVVLIGQPAEEIGAGATAMLRDGLFTRFPRPDYALALHVGGDSAAGTIGYLEGPIYANVDSIDLLVRGVGGHGARPHSTRDPVVLAAQIVVALQTIVSRELKPGTPAVVTVGTIRAGTKRNIIPDEARLELTLRSYDEAVADHLIASIRRISENLARAAGLSEDLLPVVTRAETRTAVTVNHPELTRRLATVFRAWFPADRLYIAEPATYGEDFSEFGRTTPAVPACIFWVGGADPAALAEARRTGALVPSNHSPFFAPVPEPTLKAAVTAMSAAVLDLLAKK